MISNIPTDYEPNVARFHKTLMHILISDEFAAEVENFDPYSLEIYITMVTYYTPLQQTPSTYYKPIQQVPPNLMNLLAPDKFFKKLNESAQLLSTEKRLNKLLVDAFEVMVHVTKCTEDDGFYNVFYLYLKFALQSEQLDIISVYLQMLHRLDRIFETAIPFEILKTIIGFVHGPLADKKLLNEALLLIESYIKKRHNLEIGQLANEQLLSYMWRLCSSQVAKHQCNICYTIVSQLIEVYLHECNENPSFKSQFLSKELWDFIRTAIESKEMSRRKQAIYILQSILETNENEVMQASDGAPSSGESDVVLSNIWKNYFAILESLLEIQCHLIISCLDQYLESIVRNLPPFWYSIVFALVLRHHNNVVIHYGIEFILKHGVSLQHDAHLMNGFYQALNNTYLHAEEKISEQDLAKYFRESDMNKTFSIMLMIVWQPVPLWTIVKSLELYVQSTKGSGFQIGPLLDFLRRAVRLIKSMPEVDDMVVNILQNISNTNDLSLEQVLGLYDVIPRKEIFDGFKQPFDAQKFEFNFIQLNQISIDTKISYFQHAVPDINDQLDFLDQFYEKNRTMMHCFPHYEFLLSNSHCQKEKSLHNALRVIKPRIYSFMEPLGHCTLESVSLAAKLLKFTVTKFTNDDTDFAALDSIKKISDNISKILQKKLYIDNSDGTVKIHQIRDQLTSIKLRLSKCPMIHPNKMEVLGILADAVKLEDETIDLSRFSADDEEDVSAIEGFYDCFIDKSHEFKQSHLANVIFIILNKFSQLELDLWNAYQILLAGKMDTACIFKQTHPYCMQHVNNILVDALLYGNELKGDEKQAYDFVASKSSCSTYNQKVRLTAMRAIAAKNDMEQIRDLKNLLFASNTENHRVRYYTNSYHHSLKLRITQALAFLFRLDPVWDDRMLKIILEEANQINVTHINELIIAETIDPAQMLQIIRNIDGNKGMQSMFMIIYYVCSKHAENIQFVRECIDFLVKYVLVKQIVVRTTAQIMLLRLCEKFHLINDYKLLYDSTKAAHESKVSRALRFCYAYKYRFEQIDTKEMLHTMYILREIPRITNMFSDEYFKHEIFDQEAPNMVIQMVDEEDLTSPESMDVELGFIENAEDIAMNDVTTAGGNVQRKLVTYRETFVDRQILNSLSDEFKRRDTKTDSDLIILGSLLTKSANLGGISRTGEVFGVKGIALDSLKHLKANDFTSISMASEKWLKFFEVKSYNIVNYLMAMKSNGYAIVGAEQTAYGGELHNTQLPKKMVLVLGHEKDGIPANILNLLDMAIEIPQFGVVRSLNVHVSASLFMWEYCKQHIITEPIKSP